MHFRLPRHIQSNVMINVACFDDRYFSLVVRKMWSTNFGDIIQVVAINLSIFCYTADCENQIEELNSRIDKLRIKHVSLHYLVC